MYMVPSKHMQLVPFNTVTPTSAVAPISSFENQIKSYFLQTWE